MHKLESKFEAEAVKHGHTVLHAGWPDFLTIRGSVTNGIEVKSKDDWLRPSQIQMLQALDCAGIKCYVYQQITSRTFETISIEDVLSKDKNLKWYQTDRGINWDKGRTNLHEGIEALKEIGISDYNILRQVKIMLSAHSSKQWFEKWGVLQKKRRKKR